MNCPRCGTEMIAVPRPCRKCGGAMKPGQALENTLVGFPDFLGDTGLEAGCTVSRSGPPKMVDCLKCADCGWSVHPGAEYEERCPVCQGTVLEALDAYCKDLDMDLDRLIAARDAAKKAEGRLEGLKEAAGICEAVYESDDKARHDSMYLQGFEWGAEKCEQAIRAAMEAE